MMSFDELYNIKNHLVIVDQIFSIDHHHFIVRGWFHPNAYIDNQLTFRFNNSSQGFRPIHTVRYPRRDIQDVSDIQAEPLGFIMALEASEIGVLLSLNWLPENEDSPIELNRWVLADVNAPIVQLQALAQIEEAQITECLSKFSFDCSIKTKALDWLLVSKIDYTFDLAISLQDKSFLIIGWSLNADHDINGFFAEHNSIAGNLKKIPYHFYSRNDLKDICIKAGVNYQKAGFILHIPSDYGSALPKQIEVYVTTVSGRVFRWVSQKTLQWREEKSVIESIRSILELFDLNQINHAELLDRLLAPVIGRLYAKTLEKRQTSPFIFKHQHFGNPLPKPRVSVIVPLYGRYDLAMYQLADFANDPDFRSGIVELLFVCDDPTIQNELISSAYGWSGIYPVPFSVIYYDQNLGYAGANNVGVAQSKGEFIVLLNSDVLPKQSGWITESINYLSQHPEVGVIGPTLLFYDGTIQHQGMSYLREDQVWGGLWRCSHPRKGLLPENEITTPQSVSAVTGACLITQRSLYQQLKGLSEDYILGDFEDSDYCLKVRDIGLDIHWLPQIQLYHVERQSQTLVGGHWKERLSIYNAWVHQQRWGATIQALNLSKGLY
jgi:GT2 family glycosyltransferase